MINGKIEIPINELPLVVIIRDNAKEVFENNLAIRTIAVSSFAEHATPGGGR